MRNEALMSELHKNSTTTLLAMLDPVVCFSGVDGSVRMLNYAACSLFKLPRPHTKVEVPSIPKGLCVRDFFPPNSSIVKNLENKQIMHYLCENTTIEVEILGEMKAEITSSKISLPFEDLIVSVFRDQTEKQEIQRKLIAATQMEAESKGKTMFFARFSHQLRNIIHVSRYFIS
jgi:hypothetical protein